ncbi:MAG: glycosyl hydrolase family 28 protein [Niabella sp.]
MDKKLSFFLLYSFFTITVYGQDFNIFKYHAIGDGKTLNTTAIQKAIDECARHGGGNVIVPAGTFLTAGIFLKDNVNLHLEPGAVLLGDYQNPEYRALVYLKNVKNAAVTGTGTIAGNGAHFKIGDEAPNRPYVLFVENSEGIQVKDIHFRDGASWTLRLFNSKHILIRGISIYSHANFNNDGIDIDSKDVLISDCNINTGDDALCFKSDNPQRMCENISVINCQLASNCNFIKMGTSSYGGFRNITISNCHLQKTNIMPLKEQQWNLKSQGTIQDSISGLAGIALEVVDGGSMDQITISNISMTGVQTPIFIRLGNRRNAAGSLKNILISQITAKAVSQITSSITAVPGFYVENVTLRDLIFELPGGITTSMENYVVPEKEKAYPENRQFGWILPAYGMYIRHAKKIALDNIQFHLKEGDERPAIILEDVSDCKINAPFLTPERIKQINTSNIQTRF